MEKFGNELRVQQGEGFNLDLTILGGNEPDIPFIVTTAQANDNACFVVTVASTKYEKNERYVKSWWNSLKEAEIPDFKGSTAINCGELLDETGGETLPTQPGQGTFAEFTAGDDAQNRYLYRYTKESDASEPSLARKPYHYFYFVYDSEGEVDDTVDGYECKLTFNFLSTDTAEWTGQDYLYQITLVAGQLLDDRLNEIYNYERSIGTDVSDWPETADTNEELTKLRYNYVKARWPDALQQDIDADSYLGTIENPVPILRPTKIEVKNNLRRLI